MTSFINVLALLAVLALSVNAYIDPTFQYRFSIYMNQQQAGSSATGTDSGQALLQYNPQTKSLTYYIFTNIANGYTRVGIYGPSTCYTVNPLSASATLGQSFPSGQFNPNDPLCAANTGTQQQSLGVGPKYDYSSVTLSAAQETMLFSYELYLRVDSAIFPNGHLVGRIYFQYYTASEFFDYSLAQSFVNFVTFGGNTNGAFPNEAYSSTSNTGFATITYQPTPGSLTPTLTISVWNSVTDPGEMSLSCPNVGGVTVITQKATNGYFTNNFKLPTANTNMLAEMTISGNCYLTIVSAAYPNGELFGRLYKFGAFEFIGTGSNEVANPNTNNFFSCMGDFDQASKILGLICFSNITTDSVTSIAILDGPSGADSSLVLCSYSGVINSNIPTTAPSATPSMAIPTYLYCLINSTYINDLYTGNVYIQVDTVANPTGSVRAASSLNQQSTNGLSSGLSQSAKIAIGVVIGGVAFIAIVAVLVVVAVRRGMCNVASKRI